MGSIAPGRCQLRYCDWIIVGKITTLEVMLDRFEGEFRASEAGKGSKELLFLFSCGIVTIEHMHTFSFETQGWVVPCTAVRNRWAKGI